MFVNSAVVFFVCVYLIRIVSNLSQERCFLPNGHEGRCKDNNDCPDYRMSSDDANCSAANSFEFCCESRPEDSDSYQIGKRAKKECQIYKDTVFAWTNYPYIIGGENASPAQFPYMALLGYGPPNDTTWNCGGTLISAKFVLTAAHCLISIEYGPVLYVRLGEVDVDTTSDLTETQDFYVINATFHPEYRYPKAYHDIAILELDRNATFSSYVQPACLNIAEFDTFPKNLVATGWGYVDTDGNRNSIMQFVNLELKDFANCSFSYAVSKRRLSHGLKDSQLCAGSKTNKSQDTCKGDSGGPLALAHNDRLGNKYKGYTVVGVTSFGKLCGLTEAPGVYTKVKSYVNWIESIVWPHFSDKVYFIED